MDPFTSIDDLKAFTSANGPNRLEVVALLGDQIVGFVGLYGLPGRQDYVASFTLAVHDRFQQRGIGSALMMIAVVSGLGKLGLQRIQAIVFTDNHRALSLYKRLGFSIEGRLSKFVRRGEVFVDGYLVAWVAHAGRGADPGHGGMPARTEV